MITGDFGMPSSGYSSDESGKRGIP